MVIFISVVWSLFALKWLLTLIFFEDDKDYENWDPHREVIKTTVASICLDLLLAGSEIFHRIRLELRKRKQTGEEGPQEVEMLNHPTPPVP